MSFQRHPKVEESLNFSDLSRLAKTERAIYETIEKSNIPQTPIEIHRISGINHATVRFCVRKLERLGFVRRLYHGHYVSVSTFQGVGGSVKVFSELPLPRLHKLAMVVEGLDRTVLRHSEAVSDNDFYRLTFVWAGNGSVVIYSLCKRDFSFDPSGLRALGDIVKATLGLDSDDRIQVVNYELNRDFAFVNLKGLKEATFGSFYGTFLRIYNKTKDKLRVEVGGKTQRLTLPQAIDMLNQVGGGVGIYNTNQLLFQLAQEMQKKNEIDKFKNELVNRLVAQNRRLIEALFQRDRESNSQRGGEAHSQQFM